MILDSLANTEVRGEVTRACPEELPGRSLPHKVTSDHRADSGEELVAEVEEGGALGCEGPLVEVREVSCRLYLCEVDVDLSVSVGAVNEERDALFLEELGEGVDGEDDGGDRGDVVKDGQLDLLWVAVHEVLHAQLDAFRRLQIFSTELQLPHPKCTSRIVMP